MWLQFYSYTVSSVDQDWASPQCVRIVHISTSDIGSTKRLELTTDSEHQLKSQASHGQLHGLGPDIQMMLLKVRKSTRPDPCKFDVTLAYETSLGNEHELTAILACGQMEFRYTAALVPMISVSCCKVPHYAYIILKCHNALTCAA